MQGKPQEHSRMVEGRGSGMDPGARAKDTNKRVRVQSHMSKLNTVKTTTQTSLRMGHFEI